MAENDNTVKRYKTEVKKAQEFSISKFAKDLLECRDNLDLAFKYINKTDVEESSDIKFIIE